MELSGNNRVRIAAVLALATCGVAPTVFATSGNWVPAPASGAWETAANWTALPGSTTVKTNADTATFLYASSTLAITPDANRNLKSITFDTLAGNYVIGTTSGNTLILTSAGVIKTAGTLTAGNVSETINAPLSLMGTYSLTAAATQSSTTLTLGGTIAPDSGAGASLTLALGGANTGANTVSGAINDNTASHKLALTKGGAGTWILSGTNSYTGNTIITDGVLSISSDRNLGAVPASASTNLTFSGTTAVLRATSNTALDSKRNVSIGTGFFANFDVTSGNTLTVAGVISGTNASGLTKTGAGSLKLTGTDTYAGVTTVNGGTLEIAGGGVSGGITNSGASLVLGGGTLSYTTAGTNTQTFTSTTLNAGASAVGTTVGTDTVALKAISRSVGATLDIGGTGNITTTNTTNTNGILGGYATYNGNTWAVAPASSNGNVTGLATYIAAGNVGAGYANQNIDVAASASPDSAIAANSLRFNTAAATTLTLASGNNTLATGGILVTSNVGANDSVIGGGTLLGASGKDLVVIQNNTAGALQIDSAIADNVSKTGLTKSGAGKLTLTAANTYTGDTYVNAGTLQLNNGLAAQYSTVNVRGNVAFGNAVGTFTFGGLAGTGNLTLGAVDNSPITLQVGGNNADTTFAGSINNPSGGAGTLTKTGSGTLTLTGANTFTGGLNINQGRVLVQNSSALSGSLLGLSVADGGTLELTSAAGSGIIVGNIPITINGENAIVTTGGSNIIGPTVVGNVSESGPKHIVASTTIRLAGNASIASNGALGNIDATIGTDYLLVNANVTPLDNTAATTTLTLRGTNTSQGGVGSTANASIGDSALSKANAINGNIHDNGSNKMAVVKSDASHWIISDPANSYTGGTTINGGVLHAVNGYNPTNSGNITPLGTGDITLNGGTLDLRSSNSSNIWGSGIGYTINVAGNASITTGRAQQFTGQGQNNGTYQVGNLNAAAQLSVGTTDNLVVKAAGTTTLTNNATFDTTGNIGTRGWAHLELAGLLTDGAGSYSLTKSNTGILGYSSSSSATFDGGTRINAGALVWRPGTAVGAYSFGTGNITLDGPTATFALQGGAAAAGGVPNYSLSNNFSVGSAGGIINVGGIRSDSSTNISNIAYVVQYGGNVTLGGDLTLDAGAINGTAATSLGATSPAFFAGTLTVTDADRTLIADQLSITTASQRNLTWSGDITQDQAGRELTIAGRNSTVLVLQKHVTVSNLLIAEGKVIADATAAITSPSITVNPTAAANSILQLNGNTLIDNASSISLSKNGSFYGQLALNFTGAPEIVHGLTIDGTSLAEGVYSASDYANYLTGTGSIQVVIPEPTSLGLLGGSLLLLGRRRRTRC